jgi:hypothetical protein
VPGEHRRDVREHHAERRAGHNRVELLESRRQAYSGDLRLVPDLGEEEGN